MTYIKIEGAEELIKKIDDVASMNKVKGAIMAGAYELKDKMADYPSRRTYKNWRLYGNSEAAKRMRAGFFYHLNRGEIEVPYRRGQSSKSEKLGQSWTVKSSNSGLTATVGTNASYAKLVQSSEKQTSAHKHTGWITDKQAVMLYGKKIADKVLKAITDILAK
jgi:hypothetical protein